jgi:rubredoxin
MKKWLCTLCGQIYDPEKENPPGEAAGAARCFCVDEKGDIKDGSACTKCGASGDVFKECHD